MAKTKTLLPEKSQSAKLVPWNKIAPLSVFKLGEKSRAGIILDQKGTPQFFLFDTHALLDILSEIDEKLVDRLSSDEYHSRTINPAGWLIDEIEAQLPLNPQYIQSLKIAIDEANKKGWIPFSKIQDELRLT